MRLSIGLICAVSLCGQVSVWTGNYDNTRANANTSETVLTQATVSSNFGIMGTFTCSGSGVLYNQPLVISGTGIAGSAPVVLVASMTNDVCLFNGSPSSGFVQIWHVNLGTPVTNNGTTDPQIGGGFIGVLGTPVVDTATNVAYICADLASGGWTLFALNLADGSTYHASVSVSGTFGGTTFVSSKELQRPGLLLTNGNVYPCFGSIADISPWAGWCMAYNKATLAQTAIIAFATASGSLGYVGAAIWHSGGAPAVDSSGNIYVMTGNGYWDGTGNYGQSFVKLNPSTLAVIDFATPANYASLNTNDYDLGSGSPITMSTFVMGCGKDGNMWLLNQSALGQLQGGGGNPPIAQTWQTPNKCFSGMAFANNTLFIAGHYSPGVQTAAYSFNGSTFNTTAAATGATNVNTGVTLAYTSNGSTSGTQLVWQLIPGSCTVGSTTQGVLQILHGTTLATLFQTPIGNWCKFSMPTIANGYGYINRLDGKVTIVGNRSTLTGGAATIHGNVTVQ
jgi:hypothetical protein